MSHTLGRSPAFAPATNLTFITKATIAGKVADGLSHLILLYMLLRTLSFVYRRKNGQVGPALVSVFLKFWATWGLAHFVAQVLSLYLGPFGLSFLVSTARAVFLLALSWGSNLPVARYVYDAHVHPFVESHEADIEGQLSDLREKWAVQKKRLADIADKLLTRYAIGGLPNITGSGPGQKEVAEQQADEFDTRTGRRVQPPRLPDSPAFKLAEKIFFSPGAEQPAETVAEAAYRGVLIRSRHDSPKAAYTDSRALRESFRKRAKNAPRAAPKSGDEQ